MTLSFGVYDEYSTNSDDVAKKLFALGKDFERLLFRVSNTDPLGGELNVRSIISDFADFLRPPLDVISVYSGGNQSIPNADYTLASFDSLRTIQGTAYSWSSLSPSSIVVNNPSNNNIHLVCGHVNFATNSSGFRQVSRSTGSTNGNQNVSAVAAFAGGGTIVPFVAVIFGTPAAALSLSVWQNSGAALNIVSREMTAIRIALRSLNA